MIKKNDIKFLRVTYLRGPNIWTYRPVLEAWLDIGELEETPSNLLPGFTERLTAWLPGLIEHHCGVGHRGGFLERLRDAYFPDTELAPDHVLAPVALPPCLHPRTGRWAAFIHPGMGVSFADEPGLEMMPPAGGQAGFLEGLESIDEAEFAHALALLQPEGDGPQASLALVPALHQPEVEFAPAHPPVSRASPAPADGLLLKDATLEDIVRHLHALGIEPTFRHVLPPARR